MGMLCRGSSDCVCDPTGEAHEVLMLLCSRRGCGQSCSVHLPLPRGQDKQLLHGHTLQGWEVVRKEQGKPSPVENALGSLILTWMGRGCSDGFVASPFYPKYCETERILIGFETSGLRLGKSDFFSLLDSSLPHDVPQLYLIEACFCVAASTDTFSSFQNKRSKLF